MAGQSRHSKPPNCDWCLHTSVEAPDCPWLSPRFESVCNRFEFRLLELNPVLHNVNEVTRSLLVHIKTNRVDCVAPNREAREILLWIKPKRNRGSVYYCRRRLSSRITLRFPVSHNTNQVVEKWRLMMGGGSENKVEPVFSGGIISRGHCGPPSSAILYHRDN